ncbi:MerC domain-containing protein [Stenotrophomonas sp. ZAC14D2_NAIMI4_7]|uniref:MerC family mercury resistance protein n=1 Tax=Stenotrophomonas sp. ZAC14D2_NAIMI4_7 TaxID=2072405 RepID=UPI000D540A3B|nr:MerC family mercury resistance protein [Stenotrophomonas sp. ZAC14D2_NAIMI4_7]AWH17758.1 MerC domain-containing protein [Stenotrophomonas sp. ZAC14D2_NAIMI4_7]
MDHITTLPASHATQPPASARWHARFDSGAAWLAMACAAHCITLPLLLAFVPAALMALRSFQHPAHGLMTALLVMSRWEWVFALLASVLAVASTTLGRRRHHRRLPQGLALAGAVALLPSALYLPLKESLLWHGLLTACGGVLLAAAHVANRRASRRVRSTSYARAGP